MSKDPLPTAADPDNAARERLKEYFGTAEAADYFLAWLWIGGFKVVPLSTGGDKP